MAEGVPVDPLREFNIEKVAEGFILVSAQDHRATHLAHGCREAAADLRRTRVHVRARDAFAFGFLPRFETVRKVNGPRDSQCGHVSSFPGGPRRSCSKAFGRTGRSRS